MPPDLLLVHAAPIEGHGLEDLGAKAIGVGKVAAAVGLLDLLRTGRHRAVLLFGVAGAYPARHRALPPACAIGDVVVVAADRFGDEGVATPGGFLDSGAMRLFDCGPFPADPELVRAAAAALDAPVVAGVTVSTCSGTEATSAALAQRAAADIESMEGAAVAWVCRRNEVPLLQVRAISNWTGDRDRGDWQLGRAIDAVQRAVRRLLATLRDR